MHDTFAKVLVGLVFGGTAMLFLRGRARRGHAYHAAPLRVAKQPTQRKVPVTTQPPSQPGRPSSGSVVGMLLRSVKAGTHEPPTWVSVPLDDLTIDISADDLRASVDGGSLLRLPVSWLETVATARALTDATGEEVIAPSQRIVDAIRAAAAVKTALHGQGTSAMNSLSTVEAFNRDVDRQIAAAGAAPGALVSGHDKNWILHRRLDQETNDEILRREGLPSTGPDPAVNYGGWDDGGKIVQTVGGRHNSGHVDYSQLFRPVKRWATRRADGARVDLLAWIEQHEGVQPRFTDLFRRELMA